MALHEIGPGLLLLPHWEEEEDRRLGRVQTVGLPRRSNLDADSIKAGVLS